MMTEKFKILSKFIKDMSSETKDVVTYMYVKDNISKYELDINIKSIPLKNKIVEVNTILKFEDKQKTKTKSYFEMTYATVVRIEEEKADPEELKKFILCDLQIQIHPQIQKTFVEILKLSGFPHIQLKSNIDFNKLYNEKKN